MDCQSANSIGRLSGISMPLPCCFMVLMSVLLVFHPCPCLASPEENGDGRIIEEVYHTPLAGEACKTTVFGRPVSVDVRDRENIMALTLGANLYTPDLGGNTGLPIAALYTRNRWDSWWLRSIVGVFVNEVDAAKSYGGEGGWGKRGGGGENKGGVWGQGAF